MRLTRLDFEMRSELELGGKGSVGLHNYMTHPSTLVLMLAYKIPGMEKPGLWLPHLGPIPQELHEVLMNPDELLSAFNSQYERYGLNYKLEYNIPPERFRDTQASARYLSLPANLEDAGTVLGLPFNLAKDKRGEDLIDLFSKPKKRKVSKGVYETYFNDWNSHPIEFEEFGKYCVQDVVAEEEIGRREAILGAFPLPPFEQQVWFFDQHVNDRGMPVDVDFVQKAYKMAMRGKREAMEYQNKLTGLENANSPKQLLPWLRQRGYPFNTLRKDTVAVVLKDPNVTLDPVARQVLASRKEAASTSYTKLSAILRQVSSDGKLRNQFIYMGSSRCGRWSGNAVQLHNFARPDDVFEDMDNVKKARALVYAEDYDALNTTFKDSKGKTIPALLVIRSVIRTVFVAHDGVEAKSTVVIEDDDE